MQQSRRIRVNSCFVFFVLLILYSGFVCSKTVSIESVPQLKENPEHAIVAQRVSGYLSHYHYNNVDLSDRAFSANVFDRYLKLLDNNKLFFTRADVNQFRDYQSQFVNDLSNGQLTRSFDIYNQLLQKRFKRYQYAITLLDEPVDFSQKDSISLKREELDWANSENELDEYWRKKVKLDQLNLALLDKSDEEIKASLTKRYNRILTMTTQGKAEDGFQVMMNALALEIDPHTNYLSPKEKKEFDSEMNLSFEGIGATLSQDEDYTKIVSFVKGGPAEKSQALAEGDRIIGVGKENGEIEDVVGWRLDDVVDLIKGPKGTIVQLQILPADNSKIKIVDLKRDKIHFEDREAKLTYEERAEGKVAVIEIPSFYIGLTEKVQTFLNEIKRDKTVKGIVIDLRNDGGGALNEVIYLTSLFIDFGPVVQVKDSDNQIKSYGSGFDQHKRILLTPIVVLVNRYSASASEIFAAAMQDYGRALIVGETTYGKGTVQLSRDLVSPKDNKAWSLGAIKYTMEKFYRITGESTQLKGVVPDIEMVKENYIEETGERYLDNALPWDRIPAVPYLRFDTLSEVIPILTKKHFTRIENDPEFAYVIENIQEYNEKQNSFYTLSLNKEERMNEQKQRDEKDLMRLNERLKRENKPTLNSIDELPKDYKGPDPYLDESVNILLDWTQLE